MVLVVFSLTRDKEKQQDGQAKADLCARIHKAVKRAVPDAGHKAEDENYCEQEHKCKYGHSFHGS